MAKFTDVFEDVTRQGRKIPTNLYLESGLHPIIDQGQSNITGYTNETNGLFTEVPAIAFGDHTRIVKYIDTPCFLGADGVKLLKAKDTNANYKYLYYALCNADIPNTGYNRHFKWLKEVEIPDYSSKEQNDIVAQFEKIDLLIHLRKQQLSKLDKLVKSRFIELFGDPVENPLCWRTKPLLEMGYCKNGMNFHTGDGGIEMRCLGVGDFKDHAVIDGTDELPMISLNEQPPEESMLRNGDIVFVRSNGNKALVGRCLVVYPHKTPTTYSGFCIRYRMTTNEVNTQFLLRALKAESMRKKMAGRGANIQNLNQQTLASLDIPTPPSELQEQFAAFVEQNDKSKLAVQHGLDKLELMKKALMQKYFG